MMGWRVALPSPVFCNWNLLDLANSAIAYAEITQHKPAGALPHQWK
jgi:LDH2 family malate/lactate/ureidoglycolate dehydrogenase